MLRISVRLKRRLFREKPKITVSAAKQLNEKWNDAHVQKQLSDLPPEETDKLRNALAVVVATRRDHEEILKKFVKSPLRSTNEIVPKPSEKLATVGTECHRQQSDVTQKRFQSPFVSTQEARVSR